MAKLQFLRFYAFFKAVFNSFPHLFTVCINKNKKFPHILYIYDVFIKLQNDTHMNVNYGKANVISKLCFLLFGITLTIGLQAQTTIKGKVTDSKGQPIPGASVTIKNSGAGTASSTDGTYQFIANLKQGKYDLVLMLV